ncbi:MAG: NnrU family protein [Burkholderiales bacterium]|nr:MAG: NnrU family protein [Burkholderiales bacterium]
MTWLILGLVIFLGVHSVSIVAPAARERWLTQMGEGGWKGIYSLLSFVGLALIIWGYGQARLDPVQLYTPPAGLRHLSALLMLPVFPLLLAPYLPGRLKTLTRHPMLVATKLWALAHLLANGTLADVLLFGGFLAWAVADRISVKRRERAGLARTVPGLPASGLNDVIAIVAGLGLYLLFVFWAHAWLFGVRPFG